MLLTVIVGATEQPVNTADEVMSCLDSGSAGRQVGTTNMNEHSSRSHTIFTLYIGKGVHKLHTAFVQIEAVESQFLEPPLITKINFQEIRSFKSGV